MESETKEAYSAIGQYRAARRRTEQPGECKHCGKAFRGYAKQAYCSQAHKQAAYRERRRSRAQVDTQATEAEQDATSGTSGDVGESS